MSDREGNARRQGYYRPGWQYGSEQSFANRVPGRPVPLLARALTSSRTLGWSRWRLRLADNFDSLSATDGIETLVLHRGGATARRVDAPGGTVPGQISLLPKTGSVWASTEEVEFDQFYLRAQVLVQAAPVVLGRALQPDDVLPFTGADQPVLQEILEELAAHLVESEQAPFVLDSYGFLIAEQLLADRREGAPGDLRKGHNDRLKQQRLDLVLDHLHRQLDGELDLAELAEVANLSQFHFIRAFRQMMGRTPHRYVLECRVRRAQELLAASDAPIAQVALNAGFSSQAHLTSVFKKYSGHSPAAFRRAQGREM